MEKKVIIVREGHWGLTREGDYGTIIEMIKRFIEAQGAEVKMAETFDLALRQIEREKVDVVVFITRGMIRRARKLKDQYPKLRVVIFSSALPQEGEEPFLSLKGLTLADKNDLVPAGPRRDKLIRKTVLGL